MNTIKTAILSLIVVVVVSLLAVAAPALGEELPSSKAAPSADSFLAVGPDKAPLPPPISAAPTAPERNIYSAASGGEEGVFQPLHFYPKEPLKFNGGYVQHRPHVYVVFWGSEWNEKSGTREKLIGLYQWITGSTYNSILTQYFDRNGPIQGETDLSSFTDTRVKKPTNVSDADIRNEVFWAINNQPGWGSPNYEHQYVVITPPGATLNESENEMGCAYHQWLGAPWETTYTIIRWPETEFCKSGSEPWVGLQGSASHEWAESATDPIYYGEFVGWENGGAGGEIADECQGPGETIEAAPGIFVAKLFDNYLDSATGAYCVKQDATPSRFGVATGQTIVSPHKFVLQGQVNPAGWSGSYQFELIQGGTVSYWPASPGALNEDYFAYEPVSQTLTGFTGNTTYTVRLNATSYEAKSNSTGQYSWLTGGETTFTTPDWRPAVITEGATNLGSTMATLNGSVNPNGEETKYYFEYGHTTSYGSKTSEVSAGSGTSYVKVSKELTGLEFGSTYHYRLVASNGESKGVPTKGADQAFTTGWRTTSNPQPGGAKSDELTSVSCLSSTECMGVGSYTNSSGDEVTLAEQWNGTSWDILPTELPAGATSSHLEGVSCTSSTSCMAVGFYHDSVTNHYLPLAQRWNGIKWELMTNTKSQGSRSYLYDVSCSSSSSCMAVGFYPTESPEVSKTFAEYWNGSTWEIKLPLNPETPGGEPIWENNTLRSVSCVSSTDCKAVGWHVSSVKLVTHYEALAEHWNGTSWEVKTTPAVPGKTDSWLEGISCTASSACTTVGYAAVGHSDESIQQSLAMRWNGTSWSIQTTPNVEGGGRTYLYGVSCASSTFCMAVGSGGAAMRWNGSTWELHYMALPGGGPELVFSWGVSCKSATACLSAGSFRNGSTKYVGSFSDFFAKTLPPTTATKAATGVTESEATLKGTVNPNGTEAKYWFEYGTTASYGTKTAEASAGAGSSVVEVSKAIAGLAEGTKYHFRIVASNSEATVYGKDEVLETKVTPPPTVTTKAATSITESGATLNGSVNPNSHETKYWFEYGLTTGYGSKTTETSAGSGSSSIEVNSPVSGLEVGVKYHFRLCASNGKTTVNGKDEVFETDAGTKGQLAAMKTTDPFNETTSGISNFSTNWSALGWSGGLTPKGLDRTTGWGPSDAYSTVNGAYFQPTVTDVGSGIAAVATLTTNPSLESRYFSVWLDMPTPGTTRAGYELRFTDTATNTYTVTLSKWKEGSPTVLGTKSSYSFVNGNSFALADRSGTVSAWTNTGSGFSQILSASDSTFEGGNAGVEGSGNFTRLTSFKVGSLLSSAANTDAALKTLHLTDAFATSESPLSEGGTWAALNWDTSTSGHNTGQDTTVGWGPYDAYSTVNGAYWTKASFADTGSGDAATAVLGASPGIESRYFSLWLNAPTPASAHSGYELRLTYTGTNVYEVALLKWSAGTKTVLASKIGYSFLVGSKFALVDKAGTVSAWTNTGAEYTQLLSASDWSFTGGYTGVEASGNNTRLKEFRSGQMAPF